MITFNMADLMQYIKDSSKQVQELTESLNFNADVKNMSLDENNMVSIREGNEVLKVFLENNLKKEIDNYILRF